MLRKPKYQIARCYTATYKIIQCNDTYEPKCTVLFIHLCTKIHGVQISFFSSGPAAQRRPWPPHS